MSDPQTSGGHLDLLHTHPLIEEILEVHRDHARGDERGWTSYRGETAKVEVSRSGDLAYAIRIYAFANPPIDKGKFFDVWKKQTDGSWKAVVSTFNFDLPVTPPAR